MQRRTIVTLVSDQAVPNVLFLREEGPADRYLFISTEKMEARETSANIIKAAGIDPASAQVIMVTEDSLSDIGEKLKAEVHPDDDEDIVVNITGGTKVMSLGVYKQFADAGTASIYYLPIGKNEILRLFPLNRVSRSTLAYRINLLDYLTAYGIIPTPTLFERKNTPSQPASLTRTLFGAFTGPDKARYLNAADALRPARSKGIRPGGQDFEKCMGHASVFRDLGLQPGKPDRYSSAEAKYMTGDWFEEYIYSIFHDNLALPHDFIGMGIELTKGGSKNEYDVMFTYGNALYVIECKTTVADLTQEGGEKFNSLLTDTLYKAASLKQRFGLWVNYYFFSLNNFDTLPETSASRAKDLGISTIGVETLSDPDRLEKFFSAIRRSS